MLRSLIIEDHREGVCGHSGALNPSVSMSFCPVDSRSISIVYLIMSMTYFNSDILEYSFSDVVLINEFERFQ